MQCVSFIAHETYFTFGPAGKKIGNANQEYIVNLEMLTEALEKCQYCDKGPLELANSCQDM